MSIVGLSVGGNVTISISTGISAEVVDTMGVFVVCSGAEVEVGDGAGAAIWGIMAP